MSNWRMDSFQAEYDALMAAVDADLEAGNPEKALARLEEFIQKHARPDDDVSCFRELLNFERRGHKF